jgi:lysyl-tRNA synthetase class 2
VLKKLTTPQWSARIVWLVGAVTLLSAVSPALHDRARLIVEIVPPVFPAAATTGAAAVGMILMVLSRALRRGKFRAWLLAVVLSAVATVLHVLKGLDIEEAVLSGAVLGLLLASRRNFTARADPRSLRRVVTVLVGGTLLGTLIGWVWLTAERHGQAPGTTSLERLEQAFLGLWGIPGPVELTGLADTAASVALVVLGASVLFCAVVVALQPKAGPHPITGPERDRLQNLLGRWSRTDSLSCFALRDDRAAIFSPSGKAAISYRVVGTVSLAGGDPLGDSEAWPGAISAWLDEAHEFGWVPAVLGASEQGAEAFHRAGFDALELGDEAILHVDDFSLEGRGMRGVRQAVARCDRAGLKVTCHRVAELDDEMRAEVVAHAKAWRDGAVERGFSMALGRVADPRDDRAVVVLSTDGDGELRGLLQLLPWGDDGLSLDVMSRDRDAENGTVEQLVTGLMAAAPALGVRRVSLNFAVFRSVFARGERLGAGPVLRMWRSVLLAVSRFWQIESLYRANAKFRPVWTPRFVCFRSGADVARISVAALRAEAFLVAPRWLQRVVGD